MSRSDDSFSLDDMMEIFGDAAPAPVAVAKPVAPAPVSSPVTESDVDSLSDDEMAILEAYEKSKKAAKQREEEARQKKDQEAKRILEDYEKQVAEQQAREAKKTQELEEKQKRELEELKKKEEFKLDADRMAEEERKIIEEFERATKDQKEKEDVERKQKEAAAQAELARLAAAQKAEEESRHAEEAKQDEALQAKASEVTTSKKDSRLLELLAKAQQDLAKAPVIPALPSIAASGPAPGGAGSSARDVMIDIESKEMEAFLWMLDETRKAMFTYLAPLIGIKASTNMLSKTVEKARAKAPVLLKDANWRADGALREDGSVDPERIARNVASLPAASRVEDFIGGLRELVQLRIKTVEAGLGAHTASELRNRCLELRPKLKEKAKPEWLDLFLKQIVE